jgi:hypothetical protein
MNDRGHDLVALTVVCFLGTAALLFGGGVIFLVHASIGYEKIDPSTVALVSGVSTLAGAAMGALGSILASTGKGVPAQPAGTPADPVNVQTADKPLDVTPVPADVHPDAPDKSDL